ncbi:MAG TPA: flavin reductase [Acidimicrobiales bacterium]|nr:flavin reductase [Acidimicrobiales bacterium]
MTTLAFDDPLDAAHRRRLLWAMPTGLYVLGSRDAPGTAWNLMTHSLAVQASVDPCVVAVAVEVGARTHAFIDAASVATLTVLRRDQRALARRFVKPVDDVEVADGAPIAMAGVAVALAPSGAPHLSDAAGVLDLVVLERVRFASHTLFCCEVTGVAASAAVLEGTASERLVDVLRMEDTKMSYGG